MTLEQQVKEARKCSDDCEDCTKECVLSTDAGAMVARALAAEAERDRLAAQLTEAREALSQFGDEAEILVERDALRAEVARLTEREARMRAVVEELGEKCDLDGCRKCVTVTASDGFVYCDEHNPDGETADDFPWAAALRALDEEQGK